MKQVYFLQGIHLQCLHLDKSLHANLCMLEEYQIDGEVHNVCPGTDP